MGPAGGRVLLARHWGISPADLRDCTYEEIHAMWAVIKLEAKHRGR